MQKYDWIFQRQFEFDDELGDREVALSSRRGYLTPYLFISNSWPKLQLTSSLGCDGIESLLTTLHWFANWIENWAKFYFQEFEQLLQNSLQAISNLVLKSLDLIGVLKHPPSVQNTPHIWDFQLSNPNMWNIGKHWVVNVTIRRNIFNAMASLARFFCKCFGIYTGERGS